MEIDTKSPVLVTGATGYIAGVVIQQLLQAGVTVHATVRDPSNSKTRLAYLQQAAADDSAGGSIRFFAGDLMQPGSFAEAMKGCKIVFHTASPVKILGNNVDPVKDLIEPAVRGTENVLTTATETPTVKRVVLTSSVAAVYSDAIDTYRTPDHKLTEECWNRGSSEQHKPYSYGKVLAERKAWIIAGSQTQWSLVAINPSVVLGPGLKYHEGSESFQFLKMFAENFKYGTPLVSTGIVDVRDVAAAHLAAAYLPNAKGRHIVSGYNVQFVDIAQALHQKYSNDFPDIPNNSLYFIPKSIIWFIGPFIKSSLTRRYIRDNYGYQIIFDNTKSKESLEIKYRPLEETVQEMFQQLIEGGAFQDQSFSNSN